MHRRNRGKKRLRTIEPLEPRIVLNGEPIVTSLIDQGAAAEVLIPTTAGELTADWNAANYSPDANWISGGSTGAGFDVGGATVGVNAPITAGLIAAYDASQVAIDPGAVDGNELQSWVDQSPTGNNTADNVSGAITRRPTLATGSLNGHDTIAFSRADQESLFFDDSVDLAGDQFTYFTVAKFDSIDGTPNILRVADSTSGFNWGVFGFEGSRISFHGRGSSFVGANLPAGATASNQWYILTGMLDGQSATNNVFGRQETLSTGNEVTATASGTLTFGTHTRTTLGARPDFAGGDWFDGEIAELLVFNQVLDSSERGQVEGYLRDKFNNPPGGGTTYGDLGLIGHDVEAEMMGVNSSAFVRVPFSVANPQFDELMLNIKYDDGFVAYLNGVEVARRNAPGGPGVAPAHDASATATRGRGNAVVFEEIDISGHIGLLTSGTENVLAIQGLNAAADDGEFLILPQLVGLNDPLEVAASDPPDGIFLMWPPEGFVLDFSLPIDASSVEASDLTVGGQFAESAFVVDADTVEFILPAISGTGVFDVVMSAGAIQATNGQLLQAYKGTFTLPETPMSKTLPASDVGGNLFTANGTITETGGQDPVVTIYYGTSDGGTNTAAWSDRVEVGPRPAGDFSARIGGLTPDTTYFYRAFAENAAGSAWADNSVSFTTTALPNVVINEFMARNGGVLADALGNDSDWIEIYNPGPQAIDLGGWILSDDRDDLTKWRFPTTTFLESDDYLVVFASGCELVGVDCPARDVELHTNFMLAGDGDYLALLHRDGTVASEFGPGGANYPAQVTNVSYGLAELGPIASTLIESGSPASTLVPSADIDAAIGTQWTEATFVEGVAGETWIAGTTGIGFDSGLPELDSQSFDWKYDLDLQPGTLDLDGNGDVDFNDNAGGAFPVPPISGGIANGGDGFLYRSDTAPGGGIHSALSGDFTVEFRVHILETGGTGSVGQFGFIGSTDGHRGPRLEIRRTGQTTNGSPIGDANWDNTDGFHTWRIAKSGNTGEAAMLWIWRDGVLVNSDSATPILGGEGNSEKLWFGDFSGNLDGDWDLDYFRITLGAFAPAGGDNIDGALDALIRTDVETEALGVNPSVYARLPFIVDAAGDPLNEIDTLTLNLQYDDGFVAYLNGAEVARANVNAGVPPFNAAATTSRTDTEALAAESFDISSAISQLNAGDENILAIHLLNSNTNDGDMLLTAELVATDFTGNLQPLYMSSATPGAPNETGFLGFLNDTQFSVDRGYYVSTDLADGGALADGVTISAAPANPGGVEIYYTLDGSQPSPANPSAIRYTDPISVTTTTTLRAAGFLDQYLPTNVDTQTYVFASDVKDQTGDGFPPLPPLPPNAGPGTLDYLLDPEIYDVEPWRSTFEDDLQAIPTLSLVLNVDDMFGDDGLYPNPFERGRESEREVSVEYFDPHDPGREFQIDAGLRIHGGAARFRPKKSFRLYFRGEYGDSRLEFPLYGEDYPVSSFDQLVVRGGYNDTWNIHNTSLESQYARDQFGRQTQLDMGHVGTNLHYVHLYINGLYWGLYDMSERLHDTFAAEHMGGDPDDYDVIKNTAFNDNSAVWEVLDGDSQAWEEMFAIAASGLATSEAYAEIQELLDVQQLADYMIIEMYSGSTDWPHNNWTGIRRREPGGKFQFFVWDMERALRIPQLSLNQTGVSNAETPAFLYAQLRANEEFRLLFADRLQKHFFNDGVLTPENAAERFESIVAQIEQGIVPEAARWGDSSYTGGVVTPDDWQAEREELPNVYFPARTDIVLDQFRTGSLYPDVAAPVFQINGSDQHGGTINSGDTLAMSAVASVITNTTTLVDTDAPSLAFVPADASLETGAGPHWYEEDFDATGWISGTNGVGYDIDDDYQGLIGTDVEDAWNDNPTSAYSRFEFDLDEGFDSAVVDGLELRMKYDDGYVVYLNGQLVFSRNAPSPAVWNSAATGTRLDFLNTLPTVTENTDLTSSLDLLHPGTNVLAIQVLNHANDLSDLLARPELILNDDVAIPAPVIYTLDGSDPREPGGGVSGITYDGEIPLAATTEVRARAFVNGEWSALTHAVFVIEDPEANIVISEINYNPFDPTTAELAALPDVGNDDFEFVEISNTNETAVVNLVGMQLIDGVTFAFGNETLAPGESAVVVEDAAAFQVRYGDSIRVLGEWSGRLSNAGETLHLVGRSGETIMEVTYNDAVPWAARADGAGASLELVDSAGTPSDRYSKPSSWRGSTDFGGSPGTPGTAPLGVVINEVLTHTDPPQTAADSIELLNTTSQAIGISGWYLSDSADALLKFEIPTGTILGPGEFVVFDESHFNPTPLDPGPNDFALSSANGDDVWLVVPDGSGGVGSFADDVHFGAALFGVSFGRVAGAGDRLASQSTTSLGCRNAHPSVGPLVISEVNHVPSEPSAAALAIDPGLSRGDLEFFEIYNPTNASVDLANWRVRGGVDLDFDAGTIIAAGQAVVLTRFNPDDPANTDRLAAFRAHYGIDASVAIIGGFDGQLNNEGERVTLERPNDPPPVDPTFTPHVIEDEVLYDNVPPWPTIAAGQSLQRVSPVYFGNAVGSWAASAATPGAVTFEPGLAGDLTGDGVVDADDIDFLSAMINRDTTVSTYDLDGNGLVDTSDRMFLVEDILGTFVGDANLDGRVNAADLNVVGINWRKSGDCLLWSDGNFDGDHDIDASDLNLLGIHWQSGIVAAANRLPRAPLVAGAAVADVSLALIEVESVDSKRQQVAPAHQYERSGLSVSAEKANGKDVGYTKRSKRIGVRGQVGNTDRESAKYRSGEQDMIDNAALDAVWQDWR